MPAQFEVILRERAVPNKANGFYKKWLCFCVDAGSRGSTALVERLKGEGLAG